MHRHETNRRSWRWSWSTAFRSDCSSRSRSRRGSDELHLRHGDDLRHDARGGGGFAFAFGDGDGVDDLYCSHRLRGRCRRVVALVGWDWDGQRRQRDGAGDVGADAGVLGDEGGADAGEVGGGFLEFRVRGGPRFHALDDFAGEVGGGAEAGGVGVGGAGGGEPGVEAAGEDLGARNIRDVLRWWDFVPRRWR